MAATRGRRLRSWVADVAHLAHPDYEWHDFAKIWQTRGEREAFVAGQAATPPEDRAAFLELMGVPFEDGLELASGSDATMGTCTLDLYRSAVPNPHHVWGPWTPTEVPGLVIHATDDALADENLAREVAGSFGARFVRLDGVGHFWPYQAPEASAAVLESFWTSLD